MIKYLLVALIGLITGSTLTHIENEKRRQMEKVILENELTKLHHTAFMSGWHAACNDPSITYDHYLKFKKNLSS